MISRFRGDYSKIIKAAISQGWTLVNRKNGCTLRSPDGLHTVGVHTSTSDVRAIRNLKSDLRRGGFQSKENQ